MRNKILLIIAMSVVNVLTLANLFAQGAQDYLITVNNSTTTVNETYTLSIPVKNGKEPTVIRGVVITSPGSGGADRGASPSYHRWLWDNEFALMGIGASGTNTANAITALNNFATQENRPELANAPICAIGFSRGGHWAHDFAKAYPRRTIAFYSHHGGNGTKASDEGSRSVPGYFTVGENDDDGRISVVWKTFVAARALGAPWAIGMNWGKVHTDNSTKIEICHIFFSECIKLRYPSSQNPLNGPVTLTKLNEANGWLGELIQGKIKNTNYSIGKGMPNFFKDFDTPFAHIAPFNEFDRADKRVHSWFPSEKVAAVWRAMVSNGFLTVSAKYPDFSERGTNIPLNLSNLNQSFISEVDTRGFEEATKVEFYSNAVKIGESTNEVQGRFTFTYPRLSEPGVACLYAVAISEKGEKRVSKPTFVYACQDLVGGNKAPTVTRLGRKRVTTSGASFSIPFTIGDAETNASNLLVRWRAEGGWTNTNTGVVGTGANRTLNITIDPDIYGTFGGTLYISDGQLSVNTYLTVEVVKSGDLPQFVANESGSGFANRIAINAWSWGFSVRFTDSDTPLENYKLSVTSDNQAVLPNSNIQVAGYGEYRSVRFKLKGNYGAKLTMTLSDGKQTATKEISVYTMIAVPNTTPIISDISDMNTPKDVPTNPVIFRIADFHTMYDSLSVTATSDNKSLLPDQNISITKVGKDRAIKLSPANGMTGKATVTVRLKDAHGKDTTDTFIITVTGLTDINNFSSEEGQLNVFPNPSTGVIYLQTELPMTIVRVSDALGKIYYEGKEKELNLSEIPDGIYILTMKFDAGELTRKIVLRK